MKTNSLLLVGLVAILGSCSTAYRSGQTPDDVYYSPAPAAETYVVTNNSSDRGSYSYGNAEERNIRHAIRDSRYRSTVTFDVGYGYNPFGYNPYAYNPYGYNTFGNNSFGYNPYSFNNYGKGFYDPFGYNPYYSYNPYYPNYGFNSYSGNYNPYYGNSYYPSGNYYPAGSKSSTNNGPRKYNLGAYTPSSGTPGVYRGNSNVVPNRSASPVRTFDNRSNPNSPIQRERTGVGNVIQRVFTPAEPRTNTQSSNRRTFSNPPTRSIEPSDNNRSMERSSNNNNAPTRSFDPPARSTPPPATNNSSSPVRTFKNN